MNVCENIPLHGQNNSLENYRYCMRHVSSPRGNLSHVSHSTSVKPACVIIVAQLFTRNRFSAASVERGGTGGDVRDIQDCHVCVIQGC